MKKEVKGRNLKIGGVTLVFLLIYIPSLFHWVYGNNIRTEMLRVGTIEESVTTFGYIIRDSAVYRSPSGGKCIPEIGEGERVAAASRIATVLNSSSIKLLDDLEEKNLRIIKAQNENRDNQNFFSHDILKIDEMIDKKLRLLAREANLNDMVSIRSITEEISTLVRKKTDITGGLDTGDAYINSLKNERDRLHEQIEKNTIDIASREPGIVSYVVDEYEEILTPDSIKSLMPQYLGQIPDDILVQDIRKREVYADKPFGKVVRGSEYSIAAVVNKKEAALFKEGDKVTLKLNDIGREAECRIIFKSDNYEGKYVVAAELDRFMSETSSMRKVSIELVSNMHSGLKVPLKSLTNINTGNMTADITLVRFNYAVICKVRIEGKDDEFAVIGSAGETSRETVGIYERYIVNPENIEEGQIIRQ